MKLEFTRYPGGTDRILTMSYDDGREYDRQLIEIFNKYHIKGSFHLNSGLLGRNGYVTKEELPQLYKGHEISAHTVTHPFLNQLSAEGMNAEVTEDRRNLEQICGYIVRGMSYPFGTYNQKVLDVLPVLGIEYSRTVVSTGRFGLPENYLTWHPTCHHKADLMELGKSFLDSRWPANSPLFYVWGHSYEFPADHNWNKIEEFCDFIGNRSNVWYATNIEIKDYIEARDKIRVSADCRTIYNPSAITVWLCADGQTISVKPGETLHL